MRIVHDRLRAAHRAACRLVLLPPAKATIDDLLTQGFVAAVRERNLPVDITLAEVGYEQVMAKTVAADLRAHVIEPAQKEGCHSIWLAGISLGAFNALHYAAAFGKDLAGLKLIAPYPGTADILNEIRAAGGPAAWAATPSASKEDERAWWHWLSRTEPACPVYLGVASEDRFIKGQSMLASLIPTQRIQYTEGDHSWPVWLRLWQHWLDEGLPARPTRETTP
jgi:pimeloyl-ACP methyl ester carboxylesterase